MFIWWLDQSACEAIGDRLRGSFPQWLKVQYDSRYGRSGRGRLWVDKQFSKGDLSVSPWPKTRMGKWLGGDFGGIVIDAPAKSMITDACLPGVITDFNLNVKGV